jgi:hypothetical protein
MVAAGTRSQFDGRFKGQGLVAIAVAKLDNTKAIQFWESKADQDKSIGTLVHSR